MKFRFKIQQYQTDAVKAVCDVFNGQPYISANSYTFDRGVIKKDKQMTLEEQAEENVSIYNNNEYYNIGYSNPSLVLKDEQILSNIKNIQELANLKISYKLSKNIGDVSLDVEMETGTGKTYVYIKTMFELNKRYGFKKFIVVVPSIAIREGVKKSFEMTEDHFMENYGKKARYFIYNSKKLDKLNDFSTSAQINVMIINIQAFNARGEDARKIYEELDEFQSRKPIDVISSNRPILILDEPQKMSGQVTKDSIKKFNPLFSINYSATHKEHHNMVYVLDALEAYKQKLVKKIQVKGIKIENLKGTNGYLFLEDIKVSKDKPPVAKFELEINYKSGKINRETRYLDEGDNLYITSKKLEQYANQYIISEINAYDNSVTFLNGNKMYIGDVVGDISEDYIRRIQIRETIRSHFEKEKEYFHKGIKVLSLFFIDEVDKYRKYDEFGKQITGLYGRIFEEEYNKLINDFITLDDKEYSDYLNKFEANQVHKGYFSIDKKGHMIDSKITRGSDISDDVSAYDLIMKDKERLLSFDEPTRFIFSHSALREGWDNPNIFQICTLRHTRSDIQRRQEVGRGLRLCVNSLGERMDSSIQNFDVFSINKLTVIANESYDSFVKGLQSEIKDAIYQRPSKVSVEFFAGKTIIVNNQPYTISPSQAKAINRYLIKNDYVDVDDKPTDKYREDVKSGNIAPMPVELEPIAQSIHTLIQSIYDSSIVETMIENGNQTKVQDNKLNENFYKKEFQNLWKLINHKYAYTVNFDSNELIAKCVDSINKNLFVTVLRYIVATGEQKSDISQEELENGTTFRNAQTNSDKLNVADDSSNTYDLLGKIKDLTNLTRRTIATILTKIDQDKFIMYRENPEDFINKVSKLIREQIATVIVDHVTYNKLDDKYDSTIFTESKKTADFKDAYPAKKDIQDFVFCDGISKTNSIERNFAISLDNSNEVVVYAKLPKKFFIPTPVGEYTPDWAIAFKEGSVKHIYFIAETKGSLDSLELRKIEEAKIDCAKKLFNVLSKDQVEYDVVTNYQDLMDKVLH